MKKDFNANQGKTAADYQADEVKKAIDIANMIQKAGGKRSDRPDEETALDHAINNISRKMNLLLKL